MSKTLTRRALAVELASLCAVGSGTVAFAQAQAPIPQGRSLSKDEEQANVALVNEFCAAFGRHDLAKIVSMLADNCVYRLVQTRPPVVGKDAVTATIKGFLNGIVEFKVLRTSVIGPVVVNERDDVFKNAQGMRTFHVSAGMFFVEKGRIVDWTDYLVE